MIESGAAQAPNSQSSFDIISLDGARYSWYSWIFKFLRYFIFKRIISKHGGDFSFRYLSFISDNFFHVFSIGAIFKISVKRVRKNTTLSIPAKHSNSSSSTLSFSLSLGECSLPDWVLALEIETSLSLSLSLGECSLPDWVLALEIETSLLSSKSFSISGSLEYPKSYYFSSSFSF